MSEQINFNSLLADFKTFYLEEIDQSFSVIIEARTEQIAQERLPRMPLNANNNERAKILLKLGQAYYLQEKNKQAIQIFHCGLRTKPSDQKVIHDLVDSFLTLHFEIGDPDQLLKAIENILTTYPQYSNHIAQVVLDITFAYVDVEDYEMALLVAEVGDEIEVDDPNLNAAFCEYLAQIHLAKKDYRSAHKFANKGIDREPRNRKIYLALCKHMFAALTKQSNSDELQKKIELALDRKLKLIKNLIPHGSFDPQLYLEIGVDKKNYFAYLCRKISQIFLLESKYDKAIQIAEIGLSEKAISQETKLHLYERTSHGHFMKKNYSKALEIVLICLSLSPKPNMRNRFMTLQDAIKKAQKKTKADTGAQI